MEAVIDFIFLGSKITVDSDHSYEIKRCLPLGRKTTTNLDSVLKSRDITLLTKVLLVRAMVFLVVMCGCESWTIKKAECWRIDAFELWLKKILESPGQQGDQTSQKKSILTIHWKDWCWSSNTLTTWWEELTHWKRPWCWETLKVGREGDNRGWDGCMALPSQWTWVCASSRRWWRIGRPGALQSIGSQRVGHDLPTEQQQKCGIEEEGWRI